MKENFIKFIFFQIFTINKDVVEKCKKEHKLKDHIKFRILIFMLLIPILYVLIFGYINSEFNIFNIIKTILFLLIFRLLTKEWSDFILTLFFYKSSYQEQKLTIKEERLKKLKKLIKR